jgi:hypothetical protein
VELGPHAEPGSEAGPSAAPDTTKRLRRQPGPQLNKEHGEAAPRARHATITSYGYGASRRVGRAGSVDFRTGMAWLLPQTRVGSQDRVPSQLGPVARAGRVAN